MDVGGPSREWYSILSREMFREDWGLFMKAHDTTYQPNYMLENAVGMRADYENSLQYFTFIGRVIGKAIHDGFLMDVRFTRAFYRHMLGVPVSLSDMQAFDPEYHKSLQLMLEMNLEDLGLDLTFTIERKRYDPFAADGKVETTETVELKPEGASLPVTE